MKHLALMLAAGLCLLPAIASAQLGIAQLHSLYPSGGQAGGTVEVEALSGENLFELDRIWFSHPGIHGKVKTVELAGKARPLFGVFQVTIAEDVPPGLYDVRVGGLYGLSSPRTFVVGRQTESLESEPNDSFEQASPAQIGGVINGQAATPADVDYFRFTAQAGQRVLLRTWAKRMESRMQPVLSLFDAKRQQLPLKSHTMRGDVQFDFTAPETGDYFLKVTDFAYGGGPAFGYRVALDPGPQIDVILPPAGVAGSTAKYTLLGRNLPNGRPSGQLLGGVELEAVEVEITLPPTGDLLDPSENLLAHEAGMDGFAFRLQTSSGPTDPVMIYFAPLPLSPAPSLAADQRAAAPAPPLEYFGQFEKPNDADSFEFTAKAKETFAIEAFAHRYGNTADPYLTVEQVTSGKNGGEETKLLQEADDNTKVNINPGLFDTLTDDPAVRFVAPADGTYRVTVRDRYAGARGDPALVYRLSIRRETPDYRLVAFTHGLNKTDLIHTLPLAVRRGESLAIAVMAFRTDGFAEPIEIRVHGLPKGVSASPTTIPGDKTTAYLVLTCDEQTTPAGAWSGGIQIVGEARNKQSESLVHNAREAVTMWDDTAEQRITRQTILSVIDELPPQSIAFEQSEITVKSGGEIVIPAFITLRSKEYSRFTIDRVLGEPRELKQNKVPFQAMKADAAGISRDAMRYQATFPPGAYTVHFVGAQFLRYKSSAPAEERQKLLEAEAKQFPKDKAFAAYVQRSKKQIADFAATSKFGGRYYHASPPVRLIVTP